MVELMRRPRVVVELIEEEGWMKMGQIWLVLAVAGSWRMRPGLGFAEVLQVGFGFGVLELGRRESELEIRLWFLRVRLLCGRRWRGSWERLLGCGCDIASIDV